MALCFIPRGTSKTRLFRIYNQIGPLFRSAPAKFEAYLGSNRTCEIGLNLATGQDYTSFVFLLDELTCPL